MAAIQARTLITMGIHLCIIAALQAPTGVPSDVVTMPQILASFDDACNAEKIDVAHHEVELPVCGWIGVKVSPMTKPFAESLGMTELYGAVFDQPEPNGPAAQAKIEAGDVITAINGTPLKSWSDFAPTISAMAPGTEVYLTTYRDGQLMERTVTLGSSNCP